MGDSFKVFKHGVDPDFLQLLEVPPLLPINPGFRRVRCFHFSRGSCALAANCTFSHDQRAPLSLAEGAGEDWWRSKPLVMTQNQKSMGHGTYGAKGITEQLPVPVVVPPPLGLGGLGASGINPDVLRSLGISFGTPMQQTPLQQQ